MDEPTLPEQEMSTEVPNVPETPVEAPVETPTEVPVEQPVEEQTPSPAQEPSAPDPSQIFKDGYDKLVTETGMCIEYKPEFMLRDDGTYSFIIKTSVAPKK